MTTYTVWKNVNCNLLIWKSYNLVGANLMECLNILLVLTTGLKYGETFLWSFTSGCKQFTR